VTRNGEAFDSAKEARRYGELVLLERAGQISDLKRQVRFELIPTQYENGKCVERAVHYVADFVYKDNYKEIVEDAKGFRTKDYIIKRKLMLFIHGIRIKEV
jgi:dsDNA-specific endonuclease/ATPase MutS2